MTDTRSASRMQMIAANLTKNPAEFVDRIVNTLELYYHQYLYKRPDYESVMTFDEALSELGGNLSSDLA